MSRYSATVIVWDKELAKAKEEELKIPENTGVYSFSYGFDHVCGYFYQFLDSSDELVVDEDSLFTGLTGVKLACVLSLFEINKSHMNMCFMDMAF